MATAKKNTTPKNSTIAIDGETSKRLEKFCNIYSITKKDYIARSLDYFELTEVNLLEYELHSKDEALQALSTKLDTLLSQGENNRNDTTIAKQQNQTIFEVMKGMHEQMATQAQVIETMQNNQTQMLEAQSTITEQTKPKKRWWRK